MLRINQLVYVMVLGGFVVIYGHVQDDHNPVANSNQQSDVAKHLLENPTYFINFNEPGIL